MMEERGFCGFREGRTRKRTWKEGDLTEGEGRLRVGRNLEDSRG